MNEGGASSISGTAEAAATLVSLKTDKHESLSLSSSSSSLMTDGDYDLIGCENVMNEGGASSISGTAEAAATLISLKTDKHESLSLSSSSSLMTDGDYDLIGCEVCFEPFHPTKRPPKLLPCGHNFCERCIFSLCCHQQYYLLDSVNCPTCRTEFNTSVAFAAPTNYDLCSRKFQQSLTFMFPEMLQTVLPQRENAGNANITVIHVPDVSSNSSCGRRSSWRRRCVGRHSGSNRLKSMRCANCSQKLNEKKCQKEARFCTRCFGFRLLRRRNFQRLACLECCVNRHNGHQLVTLDELEYEHQKLINDLHILSGNIRETSERIEENLKSLREEQLMPSTDCKTLNKAEQCLFPRLFRYQPLRYDSRVSYFTATPTMIVPRQKQLRQYWLWHATVARDAEAECSLLKKP
ncbi:unnamed protein product [Gongylonema pulchrum]|uniref:RING-type domain-containing protein n=1 Tax=Gongylonema pulchrum TaxID=637853 RepID=A0A183E1C3_9BILA|nr:unnamed protein product [Gongylonema pulchrum]